MKIFLLISTLFLLYACGGSTINIKAEPVDPIVIHPNVPDQVQMRRVEWTVFNREKIEKLLADYPNREIVLFALSAKGYENLSLNMAELIRYLKEQKGIVIYYRQAFPTSEKMLEGAETEE